MLGRLPTETVSVEELDPLQTDLEVLLASVGRRLKLLESEIQVLHNWQDKKDVKTPILKGKVVCMTMSTSCSVFFSSDTWISEMQKLNGSTLRVFFLLFSRH